jgi:hypothetical protein
VSYRRSRDGSEGRASTAPSPATVTLGGEEDAGPDDPTVFVMSLSLEELAARREVLPQVTS